MEQARNEILHAFEILSILDLHTLLEKSESREEALLFISLINLKMGLAQEKLLGKVLL